MKSLLLAILLLPLAARASDAPSPDLRLMMHASSTQQLQTKLKRSHEIPRLRALCSAQLRKKYVPTACFEALALRDERSEPEAWLIDNCVQAVPEIHKLKVLHQLIDAPALPPRCRTEIQKHYDDLRYAAETESPAALFESEDVR